MLLAPQPWTARLPADYYIDNRVYLSEEILAEERERVFGKVWAFCAHESELPAAGDYITTSVGGTPIILVRGPDAKVRAFLNICPHRGNTLIAQPAGNARSFTCIFHRWTFSSEGRCTAIPQPEGYASLGLGTGDFSLREFRVGEKLGLVFVTLDDNAPSLEEYVGEALEPVEDVLSAEPFEVFHLHKIVIPVNWKLWVATNVELYHVWLHSINRTTSLQVPSWLQRKLRCYPNGHVAFDPVKHAYERRKMGTRSETLPGLQPNEARLAHLFPDLLVNIRSSNMRLDRVTPISAGEVAVECRGLGIKGEPEEVRRRRVHEHNQFWGPFGRNVPEDALAAVMQMRAIQSGQMGYSLCAREDGVTPATSDESLRHFNREWSTRMGRSMSNPFEERR